ncbi:MAG: hypothetical protein GXY44_14990 [Phycisphaerales bacterium]|nr:hypothetical protein [Phycisphaerales bacterium]
MNETIDWDKRKQTWCGLVAELMREIKTWAGEEGWLVQERQKQITEEHLGTYSVPELTIKTPGGYVVAEPVGRNIVGADGRIDIVSFPSLNRILLVRAHDQWHLKTESRVVWPKSWSRDAFVELTNNLASIT